MIAVAATSNVCVQRRLADVLVATGRAEPVPAESIGIGAGSRRLLIGAVALAQARLTGVSAVRMLELHGRNWRTRDVEVEPSAPVINWLATLAGSAGRVAGAPACAELAIAWGRRPRRPAGVLAAIGVVEQSLSIDVDRERVDAPAAAALRDAIVQAWQVLRDAGPGRVGALSILAPQQRANLICRWQGRRLPIADTSSLVERLQRVAEREGARPALDDGFRSLDYAALWQRSGRIAHALAARGVGAGDTVAVFGRRSIEQVVAALAVLRAGAVGLAIDAGDDVRRVAARIERSQAAAVLATGDDVATGSSLPIFAIDALERDPAGPVAAVAVATASGSPTWLVDDDAPASPSHWHGIAIASGALLRFAAGDDALPTGAAMRLLNAAPLSSAQALVECWATLLRGGCCALASTGWAQPAALAAEIERLGPRIAWLPTPLWQRVVDQHAESLASLTDLLVGPEPPSGASLRAMRQRWPALRIWFAYGRAGCSGLVLLGRLAGGPDPADRMPACRPMPESIVHVLAPDGGMLPVGAAGAICIGGIAVAIGPLPDRSADRRFVVDPFGRHGDRLFCTGDRGRRLPDGRIEWLGRLDAGTVVAHPAPRRETIDSRLEAPLRAVDGRAALLEFGDRYRRRTAGSLQCVAAQSAWLRLDYPIVVERGDGARIVDIDGNEYIDAIGGIGCGLFGWNPAFLIDTLQAERDRGMPRSVHPLAATLRQRLAASTGYPQIALCRSGSDALAVAVRIARRVTGHSRIAIFGGDAPASSAASDPALPSLERNRRASIDAVFAARESLAAVVIVPIDARDPSRHSRRFMAELVDRAHHAGACVILDERLAGLRCAPGGARQFFALEADLAVFGETLANGLPIGAVAAAEPCLEPAEIDRSVAGGHPLALAAATAVLERLQLAGPEWQHELNARTAVFVRDANRICRRERAPFELVAFSSCWNLRFANADPRHRWIYPMLRYHGLHVGERQPAFVSSAHDLAVVQQMLATLASAIAELRQCGIAAAGQPIRIMPAGRQFTLAPPVAVTTRGRAEAGGTAP